MAKDQVVGAEVVHLQAGAGSARPTSVQRAYLRRGLDQPGGKLPLFNETGQRYNARTIRSCIAQGWAEPWFDNPIKPDWLVCRLTAAGRRLAAEAEGDPLDTPQDPEA